MTIKLSDNVTVIISDWYSAIIIDGKEFGIVRDSIV